MCFLRRIRVGGVGEVRKGGNLGADLGGLFLLLFAGFRVFGGERGKWRRPWRARRGRRATC